MTLLQLVDLLMCSTCSIFTILLVVDLKSSSRVLIELSLVVLLVSDLVPGVLTLVSWSLIGLSACHVSKKRIFLYFDQNDGSCSSDNQLTGHWTPAQFYSEGGRLGGREGVNNTIALAAAIYILIVNNILLLESCPRVSCPHHHLSLITTLSCITRHK